MLSFIRQGTAILSTLIPDEVETSAPKPPSVPAKFASPCGPLVNALVQVIDDAKGEDIIALDLYGKTSLADAMIVASGRSDRHVNAIAERLIGTLKDMKLGTPRVEGMPVCDWVLIDAGDVIVHLFRPEVRGFYNLEKLWGMGRPQESAADLVPKPKTKTERPPPKEAPKQKTRRPATIKAESATSKSAASRRPRKKPE